jgi:hypothetical protein
MLRHATRARPQAHSFERLIDAFSTQSTAVTNLLMPRALRAADTDSALLSALRHAFVRALRGSASPVLRELGASTHAAQSAWAVYTAAWRFLHASAATADGPVPISAEQCETLRAGIVERVGAAVTAADAAVARATPGEVEAYLLASRWDCAVARAKFAAAGAGTSSISSAAMGAEGAACIGCMDETAPADSLVLRCGHGMCAPCWRRLVQSEYATGAACLAAKCPWPRCTEPIPTDVFGGLLGEAERPRYRRFVHASFVERTVGVVRCPAAACARVYLCAAQPAAKPTKDGATHDAAASSSASSSLPTQIACACGAHFCGSCREPAHCPASCDEIARWARDFVRMSADEQFLRTYTRSCPSCGARTQRVEGCLFMTCGLCRTNWCWHCGESGGTTHHQSSCAKAKQPGWSFNEDEKVADARFMLCLEQHVLHGEEALWLSRAAACESSAEVRARRERASAHRVLQWFHVHAFFIRDRAWFESAEWAAKQLQAALTASVEPVCADRPVGAGGGGDAAPAFASVGAWLVMLTERSRCALRLLPPREGGGVRLDF